MWNCKACQQRDRHIAALEAQVAFLKDMVAPPASTPLIALEADAVLSGNQEVIEIPDAVELSQAEEEASERARILSANF